MSAKMKEEALKVESEDDNVGNTVTGVELTHNAISMCHTAGEGWTLVIVKYNPVTGDAKVVEKRYPNEGLAYVKERFKIDAVNSKELNGLDIFNNSGNKY